MAADEPASTTAEEVRGRALEEALETVRVLAEEVGPRRPCSHAERVGAGWLRDNLARLGVEARLEPFEGYATFAEPYGIILGLAVAPALLPARAGRLRAGLAGLAAVGLVTEGGLLRTPLSRAL